MFGKALALTASLGAIALALPAQAQMVCSERTDFLKVLGEKHSEAPTAMGLAANGSVLEVLTSENGSWTIIVTNPTGTSCMVASGEAWETMPLGKVAQGPAA